MFRKTPPAPETVSLDVNGTKLSVPKAPLSELMSALLPVLVRYGSVTLTIGSPLLTAGSAGGIAATSHFTLEVPATERVQ